MIRTALVAFVFAVLAPAASAADEVKPPRQTEQAAPTCRTPAAEVDPKAPPAPRLTKAELEALKKLPICPADEPEEVCPPIDMDAPDKVHWMASGGIPPSWAVAYDECGP